MEHQLPLSLSSPHPHVIFISSHSSPYPRDLPPGNHDRLALAPDMAARGRESVQPQFRIRPAKPTDVPALFQMKQTLARAEGNEAVLRASERDWLRDGFGPD